MFGFFNKKKDSLPPRPPSPFANDGNPIHQAILGIKSGDSGQVKSLLVALGDNPIILPMAEAGNLATGASLMFDGFPCLVVYTRHEFITNENASEYPHVDEVLLSKVCWAISSKVNLGLLINPGHPEVGVPLTPPIFKLFRDAVEELRPPLHCVASYPTPGEDGTPWAPVLDESDPVHQQMAKLATGDESHLKQVLSSLVDRFVTLPLKEVGRLESALVLRVHGYDGIVAVTRPEFIDLIPAAKEYPHRAQMTVRQLCSRVVSKNPALVLNPRHPSSVPIIPRLFKQLLEVMAVTPPPFVKPALSLPSLPPLPTPGPDAKVDPAKDPNLIRCFDGYGREVFITREQWRTNILPGNLKNVWDKPDDLYNMIVGALNDGFRSGVIEASKHLYEIDPDKIRGACIWGVVLMEEGRLDEAETVFRDVTARQGEQGVIFTNWAKIYAKRKNDAKTEELLWHALELDPNQSNAVGWYEVLHRERGNKEAAQHLRLNPQSVDTSIDTWISRL